MRSKTLLKGAVVVSLWLVPLAFAQNAWVGKKAPDFTLKTLDGKTVRLSDYKGKKVVLMNWWITG